MHGRRILRHKKGNPETEVSRSLPSEISLPYSTQTIVISGPWYLHVLYGQSCVSPA
jgi:hypothetical protein